MSPLYLLASDFDGTLKQHPDITESDRQAIHDFRQAGHKFGVITGRSHTMIEAELKHERIDVDFLICNNGALIYDAAGTLLNETILDPQTVTGILAILDAETDILFGGSGSQGFFTTLIGQVRSAASTEHIRQHALHRSTVLANPHITAFFIRASNVERTHDIAQRITDRYPDVEAHINSETVDIGPRGHDKGTGILTLSQYYPDHEIIAIGDHLNDLPMIKAVRSFAIRSGHPTLHDHANDVVSSVSECIARLLQQK